MRLSLDQLTALQQGKRLHGPRNEPEHALQVAFTNWRRGPKTLSRYPQLRWAYAIPNGGKRTKRTAGRLKAEGLEAGVFDYCIPVPSKGYAGLYLEFKAGKNNLTDLQREFRDFAESQKYCCAVAWDLMTTIHLVENYLGGEWDE